MASAIARTVWVFVILLGGSLAFAWVLQSLGGKIRCAGVTRWHRLYWYFVSPGVACHELGHCMGCWITGNRVLKVVFFTAHNDDYLGCVWHTCPNGLWGAVQRMIIATGPIWFGCLTIAFLSKLLLGSAVAIHLDSYVDSAMLPGVVEYLVGCFRGGCGLFAGVLLDIVTSPFRAILWLYLSYCIASEIGMSSVDFSLAWKGLVVLLISVTLLALIPFVGRWTMAIVSFALPVVFVAHALMAMSICIATLMLLLVCVLR